MTFFWYDTYPRGMFQGFAEIIRLWGTDSAFGEAIGVLPGTAKQMRRRDSINPFHHPSVVRAARERAATEQDVALRQRLHAVTEQELRRLWEAKHAARVARIRAKAKEAAHG